MFVAGMHESIYIYVLYVAFNGCILDGTYMAIGCEISIVVFLLFELYA